MAYFAEYGVIFIICLWVFSEATPTVKLNIKRTILLPQIWK
jgi:hypothetical protein